MADKTLIQWCDATWPIVQGCDPVSPGCANCYVPKELWRMMHNPNGAISGPLQGTVDRRDGKTRFTGKVALREDRLAWPMMWKAPRRIFVPSHGDIFHEAVPDSFLDRIFAVMALCPQHVFQVLTKRPERMRNYVMNCCRDGIDLAMNEIAPAHWCKRELQDYGDLPLPNVHFGVSVERQQEANERIPILLQTPAAVRWISAEPLLSRVNIAEWLVTYSGCGNCGDGSFYEGARGCCDDPIDVDCAGLDWVVAGGESGQGARPMHPHWARALRDQCAAAGVAFFFKQWGDHAVVYDREIDDPDWRRCGDVKRDTPNGQWLNLAGGQGFHGECVVRVDRIGKKKAGRLLDGVEHNAFPVTTTGATP